MTPAVIARSRHCERSEAIWLTLALLLLPSLSPSQTRPLILDTFDTIRGWHGVTSHGSASRVSLSSDTGRKGNALRMDYGFIGHMGSAAAEKRFGVELPSNFQISFDMRGTGLPNNFVIRLMDSLGNVWWVNRSNFRFPDSWTRMTIRKSQIRYGWGPSGGGDLQKLDRIMLMIDVVEGGSGTLWIDNLAVEPLETGGTGTLSVRVSDSDDGGAPAASGGNAVTGWRVTEKGSGASLVLDCSSVRDLGGVAITWEPGGRPGMFDLLLSDDGVAWRRAYHARATDPVTNYVYLGDAASRYLRLDLEGGTSGSRYGVLRLELKGPEFGFSVNDFFSALASASPRGYFPRYLYGEQSYWTLVGAPADSRKALMNEEGMIETDKVSCSLEPFLYVNGKLITWNDVVTLPSLEHGELPLPSVRWQAEDSLFLTTTACGSGDEGASTLLVRYRLENRGSVPRQVKLFVAARPFQVNPPWQTFTIVGGTARVDSIDYDGILNVNGITIVPLTKPSAAGAAEFDAGDITRYLKEGIVPPGTRVRDHFGYSSAALMFDRSIFPGGRSDVVIAVPYHGVRSPLPGGTSEDAAAYFDHARARCARNWESLLGNVDVHLPGRAGQIVGTVRSNLAYILMTADGPALQPGSRSYQRSWVRDGALTSAALLQMGVAQPVRRYIDWYARFQGEDGRVPAVVESRGPDPTPEHDSHGEFLYMIREYFSFTHDTSWLAGKWDAVTKTVRYIQTLRSERKTATYARGTPVQQACYGLLPESISHEGYCPAPMHSYWDDFFALRGLKDAVYMAGVLGRRGEGSLIAAERDDLAGDLLRSVQHAVRNTGVRFIPGCAELGDFSGLSTTVAVIPCGVVEDLPLQELKFTFDESYRIFLDRKENRVPWDSYLPYEARFIGAYVLLGQKDRAGDFLEYLMRDRRPAAWHGWAEIVWRDPRAPKSIGDMPHSWAASDFIRSFRTMLAFETEGDTALCICAGIPDAWIRDSAGVTVGNLPTHFGPLSYTVRSARDSVTVTIGAGMDIPPGGIIIRSPLSAPPRSITGAARRGSSEAVTSRLPARIVFIY